MDDTDITRADLESPQGHIFLGDYPEADKAIKNAVELANKNDPSKLDNLLLYANKVNLKRKNAEYLARNLALENQLSLTASPMRRSSTPPPGSSPSPKSTKTLRWPLTSSS